MAGLSGNLAGGLSGSVSGNLASCAAGIPSGLTNAVSIVRYLLKEASSGTTPTTVFDDESDHDLTISYGTSHAEWSSNADGNGLDFLATNGTAIAELADMSAADSIGGQLDGETEASLMWASRIDNGNNSQHRLIFLGSNTGDGELAVTLSPTELQLRWGNETGGGTIKYAHTGATGNEFYGEHIFHAIFDTSEVVAVDRAKLWVDGVQQTASGGAIPLNETLDTQLAGISMCLCNRPSLTRQTDAALWYVELLLGKFTMGEIASTLTALQANHDTKPY